MGPEVGEVHQLLAALEGRLHDQMEEQRDVSRYDIVDGLLMYRGTCQGTILWMVLLSYKIETFRKGSGAIYRATCCVHIGLLIADVSCIPSVMSVVMWRFLPRARRVARTPDMLASLLDG